jgi:hypothetical protein
MMSEKNDSLDISFEELTIQKQHEVFELISDFIERSQSNTESETIRLGQFLVFPSWIFDWNLQLSHAAQEVENGNFDYSDYGCGVLRTRLELKSDKDSGYLKVSWEADEYNSGSWWMAIFIKGNEEPIFNEILGERSRGNDLILSTEDLGFNPRVTAFRYVIYPKRDGA